MLSTEQKSFNWFAALFGFYWFPLKGLWREFRLYYIYLGAVNIVLGFLSKRYADYEYICLGILVIINLFALIHIGNNANKYLDEFSRAKSYSNLRENPIGAYIASSSYIMLVIGSLFIIKDYVSLIKFQKEYVSRTLAFTYKINNNQMYPTYSMGDGLFIDSTIPEIYAGDIVAYRKDQFDSLQIARVIAITGDKLVRKDGIITVNDRMIESKIVSKADFIDTLPDEYKEERFLIRQEANEDISYYILSSNRLYENIELKIPANKIFVIIDNRTLDESNGELIDLTSVIGVNTQ